MSKEKLKNIFKNLRSRFNLILEIFKPSTWVPIFGYIYQNLLGIKDYILSIYIPISWTAGIGGKEDLKIAYSLKKNLIFLPSKHKLIEPIIMKKIIKYHKMKHMEIIMSFFALTFLLLLLFYKFVLTLTFFKSTNISLVLFITDNKISNKILFLINPIFIFFIPKVYLYLSDIFISIINKTYPFLEILYSYLYKIFLYLQSKMNINISPKHLMENLFFKILVILLFIVIIYIILKKLFNFFLLIPKCKYYENFINKTLHQERYFIETMLLSLGVLPSDLYYYILIQRFIYFLNFFKFILFILIIILDILLIAQNIYSPELILRDFILISFTILLTSLPIYFWVYNILEKYLLPRIHLVIIGKNEKKKFEELKANFYINKNYPNLNIRNYYFYVLIPEIIKDILNRHQYKLYDVIEKTLIRNLQYYLVNKEEPRLFFHVGYSIVYFFMIIFFFLAFIFLYALKDFLEEIMGHFNFVYFSKEIISIIIIFLLIPWSIFFIRLTMFLFPHHIWSYLSDKVKQTKILDNIHILSFTRNEGVKEINPYDTVNYGEQESKRLDLIFNLLAYLIIAIILQILLNQIEIP